MIVLQRGGRAIVWGSSQTLRFFQHLQTTSFQLVEKVRPANVKTEALQFEEVMNLLRVDGASDVVLGTLIGTHTKTWESVQKGLRGLPGFILKDCEENVSRLLEKKDDVEVSLTAGASVFACEMMKLFEDKILYIVEGCMKVKHSKVRSQIEDIVDDKAEMDKIASKLGLEEGLLDVSATFSAGSWYLNTEPRDDLVAESGTFIFGVTTRCFSGHLRSFPKRTPWGKIQGLQWSARGVVARRISKSRIV
jgi:nucleosome binding factor SPN SPT16 subunit